MEYFTSISTEGKVRYGKFPFAIGEDAINSDRTPRRQRSAPGFKGRATWGD